MITFRPMKLETDAADMARLYNFTVAEPITEVIVRDWWTLRRNFEITDSVTSLSRVSTEDSACLINERACR